MEVLKMERGVRKEGLREELGEREDVRGCRD